MLCVNDIQSYTVTVHRVQFTTVTRHTRVVDLFCFQALVLSKSVKIGSPVTGHDAIICCKLLKKFFNSLLSVLMRNSPGKLVERFEKKLFQ